MSDELKDVFEPEEEAQDFDEEYVAMPKEDPIPEETLKQAERIMTDNDEIAAFNKEALGQLESPLIVHKKSDASYKESATSFEMNETHNDEVRPTLTRHRFKKDPKKKGKGIKLLAVIFLILAAAFAGLLYAGAIDFNNFNTPSAVEETTAVTEEQTTSIQEKYVGTIVIKDNYIFVDGEQVDGISGLQTTLRRKTASTTAYKIIIEDTTENNSDYFYNFEIYPLLLDMGFIGDDTEITHIKETGLEPATQATTQPVTEAETTVEETEEVAE